MSPKEVPTSESHEALTPPREATDEEKTEAGIIFDLSPPKPDFLDREKGDRDEDSIATTAVEETRAPTPDADAGEHVQAEAPPSPARPESPPEAKRSKGRTALIMSALCVWLQPTATQENDS